ncbi:MAG TPA: hypothetical protein PK431_11860 [Chitinophagales bacterium]|nr:hypothetical protein [Chitinophagales bacterium]
MKKIISLIVLLILVVLATNSYAQCPMCKAAASHSEYAKSLNTGILYLLAFPFVTIGGAMVIWKMNREKFK